MAGKGIKKVSGFGHGDHYINIKIQPPKTLTDKQSAILRAFAELETNTPGTVMGLTYAVGGKKVVMEDKDGMVADIRYGKCSIRTVKRASFAGKLLRIMVKAQRVGNLVEK